jgi:mannose-6-phosphate isomerase
MNSNGVYPLKGAVQHYQWGGSSFLPLLLREHNPDGLPWAEYWLGVHPKGMAQVTAQDKMLPLADFLSKEPKHLGAKVQQTFGELPFLLKILDVESMLSIQLHPTRAAAEEGFAREEVAGIPQLSPQRNYKDKNHKPEVMVALSDFWLLHGFRSAAAITETLEVVPGWQPLKAVLREKGVAGLYAAVMKSSPKEIFLLLDPLYQKLRKNHSEISPDQADYWAWEAFEEYSGDDFHDRGIFSIYWFNLLALKAGEGIFQGAGIPHAYLRGINVELMANSDNVLRGGLTPKHIDYEELLANIDFSPVIPKILSGVPEGEGTLDYPVPVSDFALRKYDLPTKLGMVWRQNGPGIYLVTEGSIILNDLFLESGSAVFVSDQTQLWAKRESDTRATFFGATVGIE